MFAAGLLSCTGTPPCSTATPCPESPERLTDVATGATVVLVPVPPASAPMRSKVDVAGLVEVATVVVGVLVRKSEMSDVSDTAQMFPLHPFWHTWYCCVAHELVW